MQVVLCTCLSRMNKGSVTASWQRTAGHSFLSGRLDFTHATPVIGVRLLESLLLSNLPTDHQVTLPSFSKPRFPLAPWSGGSIWTDFTGEKTGGSLPIGRLIGAYPTARKLEE